MQGNAWRRPCLAIHKYTQGTAKTLAEEKSTSVEVKLVLASVWGLKLCAPN